MLRKTANELASADLLLRKVAEHLKCTREVHGRLLVTEVLACKRHPH